MTNTLVEVAFGAGLSSPVIVFTDVSQYADLAQGIDIERGASNERADIQPGTCTIRLDNSDGRFTAARPASPYYPNVKKGSLVRVSVATYTPRTGTAPYSLSQLADDFDDGVISSSLWPGTYGGCTEVAGPGRARIPCAPGVSAGYLSAREWTLPGSQITGKLCTLPAVNGSSALAGGLYLNSTTAGTRLGWRYNALTNQISAESQVGYFDGSAVAFTYSQLAHMWLRIRETSGTVYWESSTNGETWTVRRSLTTPAWATSQTLSVELAAARTGGGGGDFFEWDFLGATMSGRYFGLAGEWPVEWKGLGSTTVLTCTDMLSAASIVKALQPMLVQEMLLDKPTVLFPLTEPSDSTSAGDLSATAGVGALATVQAGAGAGTIAFATGTGPSAQPAPVFTPTSATNGLYLSGDMGPNFSAANSAFRVRAEVWFSTSTAGRVIWSLASLDGTTRLVMLLDSSTGRIALEKEQYSGGAVTTVYATANLADGKLHHVAYNELTNEIIVDGTTYTTATGNAADLQRLTVGGYGNGRLFSGTISHLAVYLWAIPTTELTGHYTAGTTGYAGESAAARMVRLGTYANLPVTTLGSTFDPVVAQAELGSSALDHMREVERSESGKLLAPRVAGPLVFQSRDLRYNPVPAVSLDYGDCEQDGIRYGYDDQKQTNAVTVSRPGGATQRVVSQPSIDAYGEKPTDLAVLKTSDNSALDAATWTVSRFADPPPEVRQVPVEAYSMPVAAYRAVLALDVSSALALIGLPDQAPASSTTLFVEGYSERIGLRQHNIDFHTSRADQDTVWILDDPTYSVLDSTTRLAY
ncbi:hypothetical protein ABTX35_01395 [Streptomyces sp. NPDC096080]|uniref:hypothetical protein n=1 Tax=Streptomyces sp. NPDC096080 TaxID=3156693 RepID=UPI0033321E9C